MKRSYLPALLAACLSPAARGAGDDMRTVYARLAEGRDLSAVDLLRELAFGQPANAAAERAEGKWRQYAPRLTGLPVRPAAATGEPATAWEIAQVRTAERRDALAVIADQARGRRIVVLNEAHDDPEHRAFALSVAKALRPLGYSLLAVETFNNDSEAARTDMTALAQRGYPNRSTGAYIGDPVFGDFVRQSLTLGYVPVAYEQTYGERKAEAGDAIDAREEAQATHLAAIIMARPEARMLVYVGYHHVAKRPLDENGETHRWMAARLWQKTGIDPLCIDQTNLGTTAETRWGRVLRDAARDPAARMPIILFDKGRPLRVGPWRDAVDLQVVEPAVRVVRGRPAWLTGMGRHLVRPDTGLVPTHGRALVQAYLDGEQADAVPVDQVVLEKGSPRWFMLPNRPVRYVTREHLP